MFSRRLVLMPACALAAMTAACTVYQTLPPRTAQGAVQSGDGALPVAAPMPSVEGAPGPLATASPGPLPPQPPLESTPATVAPVAPDLANPAVVSDHELVVGKWGIEARRIDNLVVRQTNAGAACAQDCPLSLASIGVRRWVYPHYAWSAGLLLGAGGGSSDASPSNLTWDTYFGVGPTVSAHFLLAAWKHLAVNASPQIDLVYFLPAGSKPKTFLLNLRGVVEAELQLGFIDLPGVAIGTDLGLAANFTRVTSQTTSWELGVVGPQTVSGLVNDAFLRFYF